MHNLNPANANTWGDPDGCTGSVSMAAKFPAPPSAKASEGTLAHDSALRILKGMKLETDIPMEMREAIDIYVSDVLATCDLHPDGVLVLEKQVTMNQIHPECVGVIDARLYDATRKTLYIWEFKYGHGQIPVFENYQLISYYSGTHTEIPFSDLDTNVIFRIVQPRAFQAGGPIQEWATKGVHLRGYVNQMHSAAHFALDPERAKNHSGTHCRYCEARHACQTALEAGMQLYELTGAAVPQELSAHALGVQLKIIRRAEEQLKYLKTGYTTQVEAMIQAGKQVPGWGHKQNTGAKAWIKPVEEIIALGSMLNVEVSKPTAVITPTQATKAGIPVELIDMYSARPNKGITLVETDINEINEIFKEHKNG